MPYVSIALPAGMRNHGTDLESTGRWIDGNLVRWTNGSLRPVKGWELRKATSSTNPPRGSLAWVDNSYDRQIAFGTSSELYAISQAGVLTDITPSDLAIGYADADENLAFGGKPFGTGYYGTERPSNGVLLEATTWALDNWGQNLVACHSADGRLFEWDLNTSNDAAVISNAPVNNKGLMVTEERFLFALASGGNPRKIAWSDRENNTDWTPTASNEAGDIELQTSGEIMCGVRTKGQSVIITSRDAHIAVYQGPPYVYGFERVGSSCGVISRQAAVSVVDGAFWMGTNGFYVFNGSAVQDLPCEVRDHVFTDMNTAQSSKVAAVHNGQFGEVWWFYPSGDSTENDSYVVYDYEDQHWYFGKLDRTTGVDRGAFNRPLWFDASGNVYNQEKGNNYGGLQPYVESGPIMIGSGDQIAKVIGLVPDEETQGDVTAYFKTRFYPNGEEREYGPFTMGEPTSCRFSGRQVRMKLIGQDLDDWRVGQMRLDIVAGGKR